MDLALADELEAVLPIPACPDAFDNINGFALGAAFPDMKLRFRLIQGLFTGRALAYTPSPDMRVMPAQAGMMARYKGPADVAR